MTNCNALAHVFFLRACLGNLECEQPNNGFIAFFYLFTLDIHIDICRSLITKLCIGIPIFLSIINNFQSAQPFRVGPVQSPGGPLDGPSEKHKARHSLPVSFEKILPLLQPSKVTLLSYIANFCLILGLLSNILTRTK